jgi:hypothetical protein
MQLHDGVVSLHSGRFINTKASIYINVLYKYWTSVHLCSRYNNLAEYYLADREMNKKKYINLIIFSLQHDFYEYYSSSSRCSSSFCT